MFDSNPASISRSSLLSLVSDGSVDYIGNCSDVRPLLRGCRYYVLPSYREGTPRSILEAMSIGRPIITTNTTGCKETVLDSVNGLLVPIKDKKSLALAMQKMLELDNVEIKHMANESVKLVKEKYDVTKVNDNILKIITN